MISVRFEGGAELAKALSALSTRVSKSVLREALMSTAAPQIQRLAASMAPRDAGAPDYADHIVVSPGRAKGNSASVVVGPSTEPRSDQPDRRYDQQGVFLEFGTEDTAMQAHLRPAFDQEAVKTLGPIGQAIWRELAGRGISRPTVDAEETPSGPGGLV